MTPTPLDNTSVYQGQFGEFTINDRDRQEVIFYRAGLSVAALCFGLGSSIVLWQGHQLAPWVPLLNGLYALFGLALGLSLWLIHIYMKPLHRALQLFWAIGLGASIAIAHFDPAPFVVTVYRQPFSLLGVGFLFAALTGIFFKEAFCFNRLETKLLTPLVPVLLLGHLVGWLSVTTEQWLLGIWAILFLIFAARKIVQPIPPDIGDKSVFTYLEQQHS